MRTTNRGDQLDGMARVSGQPIIPGTGAAGDPSNGTGTISGPANTSGTGAAGGPSNGNRAAPTGGNDGPISIPTSGRSGSDRKSSFRYPSLRIPLSKLDDDRDDTQHTLGRSQQLNTEGLDEDDISVLHNPPVDTKGPKDRRNQVTLSKEDQARRNSIIGHAPGGQVTTELSLRFDPDTNDASFWPARVHETAEGEEDREEMITDMRDAEGFKEQVNKLPKAMFWHVWNALNNENTALNDWDAER